MEPLLYTHIVSDDLPNLLVYFENVTHGKRRFAHTISLNLEYRAKGGSQEPSYDALCNHRREKTARARYWATVGAIQTAAEAEEGIMQDCNEETDEIAESLVKFDCYGLNTFFPKLERVVVGTIYGRETNVWSRYEDWHVARDTRSNTHDCGTLFDRVLSKSNLQHLCIRDPSGPCNIPTISHVSSPKTPNANHTRTLHFDYTRDHDQLATPLGAPI